MESWKNFQFSRTSFSRQIVGLELWQAGEGHVHRFNGFKVKSEQAFPKFGECSCHGSIEVFPEYFFSEMGRNSDIACIQRNSNTLRIFCISESSRVFVVGSLELGMAP